MAKIKAGNREIKVNDGDSIISACEELGVPFGCYEGVCRSCKIKVIKGMENLSGLSDIEKESGLDKNERLACQCRIKKGVVEIKIK